MLGGVGSPDRARRDGWGIIRHDSFEQHIEVMTRHREIVVVMGHDVVTNAPDGPKITRRFTDIWSASDGSWQLLARQATPIAS